MCVPTGLLNYIKHWNARSSKKVFSKKAKYRLYDNFSPSNLYEKESFFIHYTLSSLFEKPCSEKCRLYSFLAKFVLNWITAATIYYEEEPGNSISMLKLERNTKIEKKKNLIIQYSKTNCYRRAICHKPELNTWCIVCFGSTTCQLTSLSLFSRQFTAYPSSYVSIEFRFIGYSWIKRETCY